MGQPKALLKFPSGQTLLEDQCRRIVDAGINKIFVVVGCDAEKIIEAHNHLNVTWVKNRDWEQGRFSSIQCALERIVAEHGLVSVLMLPVDVVGVPIETIKSIIDAGIATQSNIIPTFEGKGGHPVVLCSETIKTILETSVEEGRLNEILGRGVWPYARTKRIEVGTDSVLRNVNTKEEWDGVLK